MKISRTVPLLLFITIVLCSFTVTLNTFSRLVFAEETSNQLTVSEEEAIKAAKQVIKFYPKLSGSDVAQIMKVYDIENNLDKYFIELSKDGNAYVILGVSALKNRPIVSEIIYTSLKDFLKNQYNKKEKRIVNIGPMHYAIKVDNELIDIPTNIIIDRTKIKKAKEISNESKEKYKKQWDKILSDLNALEFTNSIRMASLSPMRIAIELSKTISNFPANFDMSESDYPNNGCGPTAGAAILWYWGLYSPSSSQYYNLVKEYTRTSLINHLADDMYTFLTGTSPDGFSTGIKTHANIENGYNFSSTAINSSIGKADYWSSFKSQIGYGRPTGVYIGQTTGYDDVYEYHHMAAYGYYENTNIGFRQIKVATGWGYASDFDYDYYRERYDIYFMTVIPG